GLSPDSVKYIGAARNLADGRGYTFCGQPLTQFPPLYPALVALPSLFGLDAWPAARWLSAVFFAGQLLIAGWAIHRYTDRAIIWPLLLSALTLLSMPLIYIHSYAWSEPPFNLLALGMLILLSIYLDNPRRIWLVLAALAAALAFLTRYVGPALIGTSI